LAKAGAVTTRGNRAELAMLPRLPDTADEMKSIALALQADPSKVLKLVKNAHEDAVKTMVLSGFSVLAFCATWPGVFF
jgi:hypothetical protein